MAKKKRLRQPVKKAQNLPTTEENDAEGSSKPDNFPGNKPGNVRKNQVQSRQRKASKVDNANKANREASPSVSGNNVRELAPGVDGGTPNGHEHDADNKPTQSGSKAPAPSGSNSNSNSNHVWKVENIREQLDKFRKYYRKKIKDPRLIPRMQEYLQSRKNKNFVSIPLMAEHLQSVYPEYARKKKSSFVTYVDRAYSILSKHEEEEEEKKKMESLRKAGIKTPAESDSSELECNSSDEDDIAALVEYKDTNSMNNMMSNLYKNSPHGSASDTEKRGTKRRITTNQPPIEEFDCDENEEENTSKIMYPSPNVLQRNLNSTGLVGPRRTKFDKYFIDRKGDNNNGASEKKGNDSDVVGETRETTIQKFLGALPSRTSYSAYVNPKHDPRKGTQQLYRIFNGTKDLEEHETHSGITEDNIGASTSPPKSPGPPVERMEENTVQNIPDPRTKKTEVSEGERVLTRRENIGRDTPANDGDGRKTKAPKTPKKQKRPRKTDGSDTETEKKEKGIALQQSSVTFADVGGNEASLTEICKLLVHMRHPEVYQQLGVTPPRGFLLHGPPGCGKTLLANAIAGELELPMLKLAATEIVSGVSGESEEKIRDLFEKATSSAPCVIFIDEIDSITPKRETASKDMERRIVAQLLACMDDLNGNINAHVLVIGATNRPDALDPALRRAGRFDREICLGIPDEPSRCRILQVLCRTLKLMEGFDFSHLARNTPGYVGADLMALTREAAMTAVNRVFQDLQTNTSSNAIGASVDHTSTNSANDLVNHSAESGTGLENNSIHCTEIGTMEATKAVENLMQWTATSQDTAIHSNIDTITAVPANSDTTTVGNVDLDAGKGQGIADNSTGEHTMEIDSSETVQQYNDIVSNSINNEVNLDNVSNEEIVTSSNNVNETMNINGANGVEIIANGSEQECNKPVVNGTTHVDSSETGENSTPIEKQTDKSVSGEMEIAKNRINFSSTSKSVQGNMDKQAEYLSVLSWLKEHPPLTEEQLRDLYITMDDFLEALKYVQPSAKREGFATIPDVTWDDIGALHEVREELQLAILAPVRHPEHFKSLGLTRAQGVLLAGPPGCGKTLLAKAVANESGINFISVKGPELLNMYVGESERAVRTVFQRARNSSPCVIFFDELDALCPRRSGHTEGNSSARVVNQLLTEMDGLEERKQVFIMAATNRPDIIDPAVLRPGRLDKTLYVGLPNSNDRLDILKCITKNGTRPTLGNDVNLARISEDSRCDCYTGADLAALVREASVSALKAAIMKQGGQSNDVIMVKGEHFETAFKKIKPSVSAKDQVKYQSMRNNMITE